MPNPRRSPRRSQTQTLLQRHLLSLLGVAGLSACELSKLGPTYDDVACLEVASDAECPDDPDLDNLYNYNYCDEIVSAGDLVSREPYTGSPWDSGEPTEGLDSCCYDVKRAGSGPGCAIGRPLLQDGAPVVARPARRRGWRAPSRPDLSGLSEAQRQTLAAWWTEVALMEHASVASFSRFSLHLLALGAPAHLVAGAHQAALDEVRHGRLFFGLATAAAGRDLGPGPLSLPPDRRMSLADLAEATAREGAIGETLGAILAARQLMGTTDEAVRRVLQRIVTEEARHAELAWSTLRWALAEGGEAVAERLRGVFAEPMPTISGPVEALPHLGLPDQAAQRAAAEDAWRRVVLPAVAALLGEGSAEGERVAVA